MCAVSIFPIQFSSYLSTLKCFTAQSLSIMCFFYSLLQLTLNYLDDLLTVTSRTHLLFHFVNKCFFITDAGTASFRTRKMHF